MGNAEGFPGDTVGPLDVTTLPTRLKTGTPTREAKLSEKSISSSLDTNKEPVDTWDDLAKNSITV